MKYEFIVDTGGKFGGKSTSVKIRLKVPWAGSTLIWSKRGWGRHKNVFALLGKWASLTFTKTQFEQPRHSEFGEEWWRLLWKWQLWQNRVSESWISWRRSCLKNEAYPTHRKKFKRKNQEKTSSNMNSTNAVRRHWSEAEKKERVGSNFRLYRNLHKL